MVVEEFALHSQYLRKDQNHTIIDYHVPHSQGSLTCVACWLTDDCFVIGCRFVISFQWIQNYFLTVLSDFQTFKQLQYCLRSSLYRFANPKLINNWVLCTTASCVVPYTLSERMKYSSPSTDMLSNDLCIASIIMHEASVRTRAVSYLVQLCLWNVSYLQIFKEIQYNVTEPISFDISETKHKHVYLT